MPARPRGIRAASVPKAALRGITTQYEELPAPLAKIQILAAPPQAFRPTSGVFDLFFFLCLLVVLLVQNFNLNLWHLYKYNLVYIQFAAYLFLTQFVWRSSLPLLASSKRHSLETFFHVFLLGVMGALLLWSIRSLILEEQLSYLPYVFYPLVLSFCLFGLNLDPAKNWSVIGMAATEPDLVTVSFKYTACGVLYSSLEACYYTVLLPIWFRKEKDPQFNRVYSFLLLIVALVNTFVLLASYVCLTRGPVLHRQAKALGCWARHNMRRSAGATQWSRSQAWNQGSIVKFKKKCYVAVGSQNTAEPDSWLAWVLYSLFWRPVRVMSVLVLVQVGLVACQFACLLLASKWHSVAIWAVMIGLCYGVLVYAVYVRHQLLGTVIPHTKNS
eukprot:m.126755 g.126755  ORF g.126755 m.126755 type:complete len:386 (-) comp23513_c0_seq4:44-1201(-)